MKENKADVNMILAGDVGGTKTLLGIFDASAPRPVPLVVRQFPTLDFPDLTALIGEFATDADVLGRTVSNACFGVAGPVFGDTAELTNTPFRIDANNIAHAFAITHVALLNDLEAMSYAVPFLDGSELQVLQSGTVNRRGNIGLIAAGTGLGQAVLHHVDGRFVPVPTEAGHADWAPRTERDIDVLRALVARFGRAEVEHVVSGMGLVHLHRVTHDGACAAVADDQAPGAATISEAALAGRCSGCVEALEIFVSAYGAEAGNLALRCVATGGVFVGGGIAPKILPALTDGRFMDAFRSKGSFRTMLADVPVKVILNAESGLLGAAIAASM